MLEAYSLARTERADSHLAARATLASELALARWLLYGVRTGDDEVVTDARRMLADLADLVQDAPGIGPDAPTGPPPAVYVEDGQEESADGADRAGRANDADASGAHAGSAYAGGAYAEGAHAADTDADSAHAETRYTGGSPYDEGRHAGSPYADDADGGGRVVDDLREDEPDAGRSPAAAGRHIPARPSFVSGGPVPDLAGW